MLGLHHRTGRIAPHRSALLLAIAALPAVSCVPAGQARVANATSETLPFAELPTAVDIHPAASGEKAVIANRAMPMAAAPNPAATAFQFSGDATDSLRAADCLSKAIYYEARSESEGGQRAVAQVVLNRARHSAYPGTVCGVVYQGAATARAPGVCQFSFACDGSLRRLPYGPSWDQARRIAAEALAGMVYAPVGNATHYHTHAVLPRWAFTLDKMAVIGAHIFYRLKGSWGRPAAFSRTYAGGESIGTGAAPRASGAERFAAAAEALTPAAEQVAGIALAGPSSRHIRVSEEVSVAGVRIHRSSSRKAVAPTTAAAEPVETAAADPADADTQATQ